MATTIQIIDLDGGIRQINFNRPERKHALTAEIYLELTEALLCADEDNTVRTILFYGDEKSFSAGNDIEDFLANPPVDENSPVFSLLRTLNRIKKPIIAAVNGPAVGIGTTMLLHCDLVFASNSAKFSMPFVNLGCTPEGGSSLLLTALLGQRHAAELLLLGGSFDSEKAKEVGLVNKITTDNALNEALHHAKKIAKQPPSAVRAAKQMMKSHLLEQIDKAIVTEGRLFSERLNHDEAKEALSAFIEKRAPDFSSFN